MPKVKISEYSATANSNTDVASINIDEGCAPSGINNAIRAIMGHLKDFQQGTNGDPFNGPHNGTVGATTPSTGAFTTLSASSTSTLTGNTTIGAGSGSPQLKLSGAASSTANSGAQLAFAAAGTPYAYISNVAWLKGGGSTDNNLAYWTDTGLGHYFYANNNATTAVAAITSTGLAVTGNTTSTTLQLGTNPAGVSIGVLGIPNQKRVYGRNAANSADVNILYVDASNSLVLGPSDAAVIDSSGNLLINKTTRYSAEKVSMNFAGASQQGMVTNDTSAQAGSVLSWFFSNGTAIGSITNNANTGVLYNVMSDQRLKENIQNADSASSLIDSLQVRQFDWKANGLHQRFGFVAQELVTVAPEAVYQPNDAEQMMAVDYSKLVPMLVKAIQEQQAIITQLTARITALEGA